MTSAAARPLDIFLDLTGEEERFRRGSSSHAWPQPDLFTAAARRVVCVVHPELRTAIARTATPPGWAFITSTSAISACSEAMKRASAEDSLLLVLYGRMEVSSEAIAVMRQ